jgi:hypothetical protein
LERGGELGKEAKNEDISSNITESELNREDSNRELAASNSHRRGYMESSGRKSRTSM